MSPDDLAMQLAVYEAMAGNASAANRLREEDAHAGPAGPPHRIRGDLYAGIVEARWGSRGRSRSAGCDPDWLHGSAE